MPPFMWAPRCMPALPTIVMRPRVMPRPIHLTFAASPRISISSLASPSTVEEIVQAALPLAEKDRQRPDRVVRQRRHDVGREHFRFERNVRLFFEGQGDHCSSDDLDSQGLTVRVLECAPSPPGSCRTTSCRPSGTAGAGSPRSARRTRAGRGTDGLRVTLRISPSSTTTSPPLMT